MSHHDICGKNSAIFYLWIEADFVEVIQVYLFREKVDLKVYITQTA